MKIIKLLTASLILALLTLGAASATDINQTSDNLTINDADVIGVSNQEIETAPNDIETLGVDEGTFSQIQTMIDGASAGNTIKLTNNYIGNGTEITIDKQLTIDGDNHTLDAKGLSRIFNITANDVTLKNIVFKNGYHNESGGAFYFSHTGTVENCNFTNNTASNNGGAIWLRYGTLTNCNFVNNAVNGTGGAIRMESGSVTNCNFTDNYASEGGAASFSFSGTVRNCNFINNTASESSGAVFSRVFGDAINCNFTNNSAPFGGAIKFFGESNVTNCNFRDNTASEYGGAVYLTSNGNVENCNFTNNSAWEGGAVYFSEGSISNCNFINNSANNGDGGAIWILSGTVENCNFINNTAYYGGAIYLEGDTTITDSTLINCSSKKGRAIYATAESTVINCKFEDKNSENLSDVIHNWKTVINCTLNGNRVGKSLSKTFTDLQNLINAADTVLNLTDNFTFTAGDPYVIPINKSITINGNGITIDGAGKASAFNISANHTFIMNIIFKDCYNENGSAGAIEIIGSGNTIADCDFINCTSYYAGAISAEGSDNLILDCNFIDCSGNYRGTAAFFNNYAPGNNNSAIGCNFLHCTGTLVCGNTINTNVLRCNFENCSNFMMLYLSNGTIADSSFNNCADNQSIAIYLVASNSTVSNCTFENYSTGINGSAIFFINMNMDNIIESTGEITNCRFINCTTTGNGGAIYWMGGNGTLSNCSFTNCHSGEDGGALYVLADNYKLSNSTFTKNTAGDDGGAIYWQGNWGEIYNITCEDTKSTNANGSNPKGGSVCIIGKANTISKSSFTKSYIDGNGGALFVAGANALITDSTFTECSGSDETNGGALCIAAENTHIRNCNFTDCSAKRGSAIFWNATDGEITDSNFLSCISSDYGGAIYWLKDNGRITDCQITDCRAGIYGGGIDWEGENGTLTHSDIVNCSALLFAGGVYWNGDGGTCTDCSFINCSSNSDASAVYWTGENGKIENSTFEQSDDDNCHAIYAEKEVTVSNSRFKTAAGKDLSDAISGANIEKCEVIGESKTSPNLNVNIRENIEIGENQTVRVTISDDATDYVYIKLYRNGEVVKSAQASVSRTGGEITWEFENLKTGRYLVNVEYPGDKRYEKASSNESFTVRPEVIVSEVVPEGTNAYVYMDFGESISDSIIMKIGKRTFDVLKIKDGIVNETTKPLDYAAGNYTVTFEYEGDMFDGNVLNYYNELTGSYRPIGYDLEVVPVEIPIKEETTTDGDGVYIMEIPIDAKGSLTMYINGEPVEIFDLEEEMIKFLEKTEGNVSQIVVGILKIDLSKYNNGKYTITFEYSGDANYHAFTKDVNVTVKEKTPSVTASNMNTVYTAGPTYTIKVYEDAGVPANGAAVVVKVNGKSFQTLRTNANGIASFKVSQTPGTYKLTITSLGKTLTRTLTVKHLVTLKTVTVKKSAKKLTLQATLGKVNGKYLKNKKITFKFNNKKYTAKTNKKGVAKVTIKSSVLKKLKVGKKVTYQATYSKDTIKKTAKVKK